MAYANIIMEGRLVNDPEFRTGKEDREYCTFRFAVSQRFGPQENSSFYSCTGNESIARRIKRAGVTKGQLIQILGNITLREYQDQNGNPRMSADVGILDWHFTGTKPKEETGEHLAGTSQKAAQSTVTRQKGTLADEVFISSDDELPI